jgi:hypothetical protein
MKQEILNALGGERNPMKPLYRAVVMLLGAILIIVDLEILHATLLTKQHHETLIVKHHVAFIIVVVIAIYVLATLGGLLLRAGLSSRSLSKSRLRQ